MSAATLTPTAELFARYFSPNPYKHGLLQAVTTNAEGQTVKKVTTKEPGPVTPELIARHLRGGNGFVALGYLPGSDTGTTAGMIDLDTKDYPEPGTLDDAALRLIDVAGLAGVKLYLEASTRGGKHAHVFVDEPLPHTVVRDALKVLVQRAELPKTEVYPAGDDAKSTWYIMPYAGAAGAADRLGRTWLSTADEQPIPHDELDEWLELTSAQVIHDLALELQKDIPTDAPTGDPVDLAPETIEPLKHTAEAAPQGTFDRHGCLIAFINLARRCGHEGAMVAHLKSDAVRAAWVKDGSRDADEWHREVDRWAKARQGEKARGINYLTAQGFVLPDLPKNAPPEEPWGELQALPAELPEVPTLPAEMIPEPLREWIADASERTNVHREFIAVPAVTALGALIGRSVGIYPKQRDSGWLVVPNLWGAIVGNPSVLKSPAMAEGTAPLRRLAALAREAFEAAEASREAEAEVLKLQMSQLKKKKGDPAAIKGDLGALLQELKNLEDAGVEKRYLTNDATIEKLGELLIQNPRGLLSLHDELMGLLKTFDKPGRENERPFYLTAWNGADSASIDRIGRGSLYVPALTLSILGSTQPGRLRSYIYGTLEGGEGDDGLLQRFQLVVWPDKPPAWENVDRYPKTDAKNRAFAVYQSLDVLDTCTLEDIEPGDIPALRLTPEAQDLFNGWRTELMNRIRTPELERTPAFLAHLAKYPSLCASLALIFHLVDIVDGKASGRVSFEATALAVQWCSFLEAHAKKLYAPELNTAVLAAHVLVEKIKQHDVEDKQPLRDIYRRQWTGLKTAEQVEGACQVLKRCNYLRVEVLEPGRQGGRPSDVLRLHPELRGA